MGVVRVHDYPLSQADTGLIALIDREKPAFIIACDDHALLDLQRAHTHARTHGNTFAARLIERSLGDPRGFPTTFSRNSLIALAEQEDVRTAPTCALADEAALLKWQASQSFPFVLKRDGTTGGDGVIVVATAEEALAAFRKLSSPLTLAEALKRRIVNGDRFSMRIWRRAEPGRVSAQPFVEGLPGNCGVACWQGEVIAFLAVEALHTRGATGAATIVKLIDSPAMRHAAQQIVRRLGLSGFCGFDFIIDPGTGAPSLIEMNARVTTLCTLAAGAGGDMVSALMSRITGTDCRTEPAINENRLVAYFPQAWQHGAPAELLRLCYQDIPWSDPGLVRRLCERPYPTRSLLARFIGRVSGKLAPLPLDMTRLEHQTVMMAPEHTSNRRRQFAKSV